MSLIRNEMPEPVRSINIIRCRNGFMLRADNDVARQCYTSIDETYVFSTLKDLYDYLVDVDFELTEE